MLRIQWDYAFIHPNDDIFVNAGAACGIGKATALLFAKLGARLVLVDLREADLNATANECNGISKTPVLPIVADITDDHMVQVIHQKTLDHYDGLDILVSWA